MEETAGTGIGLHVARVILKAHDGTVELESSDSSGTTFRFALPLSSAV